ncbi:MAG: lipopolysaccharide biosynthesis protein, partial [Nitrosomonadaceae bacterium]
LVNLPVTIYLPRLHGRDHDTYLGSAAVSTIVLCVLFGLTFWAANVWSGVYYEEENIRLLSILPVLLFLLVPSLLRDFMRNVLLAQLNVWASVRVNVTASLLALGTAVAYYLAQEMTFILAFQLVAITSGFAAAVMFWQHRAQFSIDRTLFRDHFKKRWKVGKWALVNVFAYAGSSQAYPWLLLYFTDYDAVAIFGACFAIASALGPILNGAGAYILPRMSHGYKDGNLHNLMRLLRMSILVLSLPYLLWLLLGVAFGEEIVTQLYSNAYHGYGFLFVLLLVQATILGMFAPLANALQTLERTDIITVSLIAAAVVTLVLGSFMIKQYGVIGAGIASIVSVSVMNGWRWYSIGKIVRHH